jgi:hypothetical protein
MWKTIRFFILEEEDGGEVEESGDEDRSVSESMLNIVTMTVF